MTMPSKGLVVALRVCLGWIFLYAGLMKILNPLWSAEAFLNNAGTFQSFYHWLAGPALLPTVNFMNEWGLLLLGVSLILGLFVRVSAPLGVLLMALYYLPELHGFPPLIKTYMLVDEHIIYILCLLILASVDAGTVWGLDAWVKWEEFLDGIIERSSGAVKNP